MRESLDDFKARFAAWARQDFDMHDGDGDFYLEGPMRSTVTIELVENGMLVRYHEPVEKVMPPMAIGRGRNDQQLIQLFLKSIVSGLHSAGEDAKPEAKARINSIAKGIEESFQMLTPKAEKRWVLDMRTAVCKSAEELMGVIEKAKVAQKKVEDLQRAGHNVAGLYGGCFAPAPYPGEAQAMLTQGPIAPGVGMGESDFELGA